MHYQSDVRIGRNFKLLVRLIFHILEVCRPREGKPVSEVASLMKDAAVHLGTLPHRIYDPVKYKLIMRL